MANIYYDVKVDIQKDIVIDSGIRFTQGDSKVIYLRIAVMNGGLIFDASNTTPSICFVKPDGRYVVGVPVKSGDYWIYQILGSELQAPGKVLCDIKFTYQSGRISSSKFTFMVERDTTISGAEASSSYIAPMEALLGEMMNYRDQGYSMVGAAEQASYDAQGSAEKAKEEADRASAVVGIDIATTSKAGIVKPDGETITVDSDGTIHGASGTDTEARQEIDDMKNPSISGSLAQQIEEIGNVVPNTCNTFSDLCALAKTNHYKLMKMPYNHTLHTPDSRDAIIFVSDVNIYAMTFLGNMYKAYASSTSWEDLGFAKKEDVNNVLNKLENQQGGTLTDANAQYHFGIFQCGPGTVGVNAFGILVVIPDNAYTSWTSQLFFNADKSQIRYRMQVNDKVWTPWAELAKKSDTPTEFQFSGTTDSNGNYAFGTDSNNWWVLSAYHNSNGGALPFKTSDRWYLHCVDYAGNPIKNSSINGSFYAIVK